MKALNVLIGPNGSGKSNFLEAVALLRSAPRDISEPFRRDGIREWLWKGPRAPNTIKIEALVDYPQAGGLRHSLVLADRGGLPIVVDEQIEPSKRRSIEKEALSYYRPPQNKQTSLLMARSRSKAKQSSKNLRPRASTASRLVGRHNEGAASSSRMIFIQKNLCFLLLPARIIRHSGTYRNNTNEFVCTGIGHLALRPRCARTRAHMIALTS